MQPKKNITLVKFNKRNVQSRILLSRKLKTNSEAVTNSKSVFHDRLSSVYVLDLLLIDLPYGKDVYIIFVSKMLYFME